TDPPVPQGSVLGRDPAEIEIAIHAALGNDAVRKSPQVVAALDETVRRARARPGYARVAAEAVSLIGKSSTPEAARLLQRFARDPIPEIRAAALESLTGSASLSAGENPARALA